jgi:hypothetical protein
MKPILQIIVFALRPMPYARRRTPWYHYNLPFHHYNQSRSFIERVELLQRDQSRAKFFHIFDVAKNFSISSIARDTKRPRILPKSLICL